MNEQCLNRCLALTKSDELERLARAAQMNQTGAAQKLPKRLWVVVKVERGMPAMIDAYRDKRSTKTRAEFLRLHMRPEID